MRYLVVGNCQVRGIARAIEYIDRGADVITVDLSYLGEFTSADKIYDSAARVDVILCQNLSSPIAEEVTLSSMRSRFTNVIGIPHIYFGGYHPDQVFLHKLNRDGSRDMFVSGPMHQYHSALVLFAYTQNMPKASAERLFNYEVFEKLGFFNVWHQSTDLLFSEFDAASFDGRDLFLLWARNGPFMYLNNHPKVDVLADVAGRALESLGRKFERIIRPGEYLGEIYNHLIWPVYPEIATEMGIVGNYVFKTKIAESNITEYWGLSEFIDKCYKFYDTIGADAILCDRVAAWEASEEVRSYLHKFMN